MFLNSNFKVKIQKVRERKYWKSCQSFEYTHTCVCFRSRKLERGRWPHGGGGGVRSYHDISSVERMEWAISKVSSASMLATRKCYVTTDWRTFFVSLLPLHICCFCFHWPRSSSSFYLDLLISTNVSIYARAQLIILLCNMHVMTAQSSIFKVIKQVNIIYIYIYIYMCVCVCVCVWRHTHPPCKSKRPTAWFDISDSELLAHPNGQTS